MISHSELTAPGNLEQIPGLLEVWWILEVMAISKVLHLCILEKCSRRTLKSLVVSETVCYFKNLNL